MYIKKTDKIISNEKEKRKYYIFKSDKKMNIRSLLKFC